MIRFQLYRVVTLWMVIPYPLLLLPWSVHWINHHHQVMILLHICIDEIANIIIDLSHRPYDRQKSLATITTGTNNRPHPSLDRRRTASESQLSARKNVQQNQRSDTTVCSCDTNGGHYTHTVMDQMYSSSIETIYGILANRAFLQKFLSETEKNTGMSIGCSHGIICIC